MDWVQFKAKVWLYGILLTIVFVISFVYEYIKNIIQLWEDYIDGKL